MPFDLGLPACAQVREMVMPQGTLYDYHDGKRRASTRRSPPVREEGKEARAACSLATRKRDEKTWCSSGTRSMERMLELSGVATEPCSDGWRGQYAVNTLYELRDVLQDAMYSTLPKRSDDVVDFKEEELTLLPWEENYMVSL